MTHLAVLPSAEIDAKRRWTSLVELNAYDKYPALSQNEKQALQALAKSQRRWGDGGSEGASQIQGGLRRLLQPVKDALAVMPGRHSDKDTAAAALLRACQRERRAYWGWSSAVWQRILGHNQAEFFCENGSLVDGAARQYMIAAAYLLGCFRQVRLLGNFDRLALARKVFGAETVKAALKPIQETLSGWGYAASQNTALASTVCEALLLNESPYLYDLTVEGLEVFRRDCSVARRAQLVLSLTTAANSATPRRASKQPSVARSAPQSSHWGVCGSRKAVSFRIQVSSAPSMPRPPRFRVLLTRCSLCCHLLSPRRYAEEEQFSHGPPMVC
jgi:hypothetical protein